MLTGPPPKFHGTRDILRLRWLAPVGQIGCSQRVFRNAGAAFNAAWIGHHPTYASLVFWSGTS